MRRRDYVSNELIHWTGRDKTDDQAFEVLHIICQERVLRLSYCPNYVRPDFRPQSAMVCFTDIPLIESYITNGPLGDLCIAKA